MFFSLKLVTGFSSVQFSLKCLNASFPTIWLGPKGAKISCIRLPVTVRVSKTSVLKFPSNGREGDGETCAQPIWVGVPGEYLHKAKK